MPNEPKWTPPKLVVGHVQESHDAIQSYIAHRRIQRLHEGPKPITVIVKALINPPAWGIYTADEPNEQKAFICYIRPWMIEGRDCVPRKDAKQYADLFAAAPELYALLEKIQREIGPFVFRIDGKPLAELIESALSKARGEQPHGE